jgi:DNA-binding response OmpR family regulator
MTASQQPTILFIDDDDDLVRALSTVLERACYRVLWANDGDDGMRLAASQRPDLILLDYMMPSMSGFSVCREIARTPALQQVPVIIMTAFSRNIGETCGMCSEETPVNILAYLEKPVEPNMLLDRIALALQNQQLC